MDIYLNSLEKKGKILKYEYKILCVLQINIKEYFNIINKQIICKTHIKTVFEKRKYKNKTNSFSNICYGFLGI